MLVTAARNLLLGTVAVLMTLPVSGRLAAATDRIILNRLGPSTAELYIANADGTGERKLLSTSEMDYSPSFSRDGKWIVLLHDWDLALYANWQSPSLLLD